VILKYGAAAIISAIARSFYSPDWRCPLGTKVQKSEQKRLFLKNFKKCRYFGILSAKKYDGFLKPPLV
jgi:hypothetical protein